MTRRDFAVGALAGTALMGAGGGMAAETVTAKAQSALQAWVAAWNAEDLDAMFALFVPDAHWVNIVGMHWQGRAAVERAHRVFFEMMFRGVRQRLIETENIRALPGGGAIVVARLAIDAFRQPNGVVKPPSEDRLTLVLVPQGDGLAILHGANVAIVPKAQQHDPARAR